MCTAAQPVQLMKCHECKKPHHTDELSECATCAARSCPSCHRCLCDDIKDTVRDLTLVADYTGQHKELLASLRVILVGLNAA